MRLVFRAALPVSDVNAERKSLLLVNLCVGGMVIARTTDEPHLRKESRTAARTEALELLGG
jgi:TetR/AcrR family transcriptional repressor of nem operon